MKLFFTIYILLLCGVVVLWSIEPLHRAQEASSITMATPIASASSSTQKPDALTASSSQNISMMQAIELGINKKINEERAAAGVAPLSLSPTLAALARAHSADMLANNYFSHSNASGCSSSCRITAAGYQWSMSGENIYFMSGYSITPDKAVDMTVQSWMDSPAHRENVLNPSFMQEGIGIALRGSTLYVTEDLAQPR